MSTSAFPTEPKRPSGTPSTLVQPVEAFDFWATGFDDGPLQISADGGKSKLALFEVSDGHPMVVQQTGVAFSVDAETFVTFARSLPGEINGPQGNSTHGERPH